MLNKFLGWLDWRGVALKDIVLISITFGALTGLVICGLIALAGGG